MSVVTVTGTDEYGNTAECSVTIAASGGQYALPADHVTTWNPGLNAVGGIPSASWPTYKTLSPSGSDDTAAIQAALNSCPANHVVQLSAGVFKLSGQGVIIGFSNVVLRGAGPGPGNWNVGAAATGTAGTYLVKALGTSYPVVTIGPQWGGQEAATNLTADAVKGQSSVTVASTSGLSVGSLVVINSLTNTAISHWETADPENASGWFENPNRPLGQVLEIASISGTTVSFTTPFHITYPVAQTAQLARLKNPGDLYSGQQATAVAYSGIEELYLYGGEGGDGGGGIHMWNSKYCWVKHIEDTWTSGASIHMDSCFRVEIRDSYFHHSQGGLYSGGANYGIARSWYTSDTLVENCISFYFDKCMLMRSTGGGNVTAYCYMDDGADLGGQWFETVMNSSHMTTPHYELFEGNQGANFDQDDRWGNSVYTTLFRNQWIGQLRDFPATEPKRAAGVTQWHWWQSFVGNVLGTPTQTWCKGYEVIGSQTGDSMWMVGYHNNETASDSGKTMATLLRDGNFDYFTKQVHWHGVGGTGASNGLTPPAAAVLPSSLYLTAKPAFFGSAAWPWVDGSNASDPLPGTLPARSRFDAGTPNTLTGG